MTAVRAPSDWRGVTQFLLHADGKRLRDTLERMPAEDVALARDVVQRLGLGPWLAHRLQDSQPVGPVSETFLRWLGELRTLNIARMERWGAERRRLLDAMRDAHIRALPLKSAALAREPWFDAASRPTADLDVLVQPGEFDRAERVMEALGYRARDVSLRQHLFLPRETGPVATGLPGEHPAHPIAVELHKHVERGLAGKPVRITSLLWATARQSADGSWSPSLPVALLHVAVHAANAAAWAQCRFVHILDLAAAARGAGDDTWRATADEAQRQELCRFLYGPLVIATRFAGATFPADVMQALAARTPARVRNWLMTCDYSDWFVAPTTSLVVAHLRSRAHWVATPYEHLTSACRLILPDRFDRENEVGAEQDMRLDRFLYLRAEVWWTRERARRRSRAASTER